MEREVVLSSKAIRGLAAIADYIAERHGEQYSLDYQKRIRVFLNLLASRPAAFPLLYPEKDAELRKGVFRKLTVVLYTYTETQLLVESVKDSRSNWKRP